MKTKNLIRYTLFACFYCRRFKKMDKWAPLTEEETLKIKNESCEVVHLTCPLCAEVEWVQK
jgi:hypothetical protein